MTTREDLRRDGAAMRARLFGRSCPTRRGAILPSSTIWWRRGDVRRRVEPPGAGAARPDDRDLGGALRGAAAEPSVSLCRAALDLGLDAAAIVEVLVQCGIYAGFTASEEAIGVAGQVFAERGILLPDEAPAPASLEELTARAAGLLEALHGSRGYEGYAAPDNRVTGALYRLAIQYGYWRDLASPGSRPATAGIVRGRRLHRAAPRGTGQEVRPIGAQRRARRRARLSRR